MSSPSDRTPSSTIPRRRLLPGTPIALGLVFWGLVHANPAAAGDVTVAFVGDQGVGESAQAVLQLIADKETDLLIALGDLGYEESGAAQAWIDNVERIFGPDFPVLAVVGNHENREWPVYQRWLAERAARVPDLVCEGVTGVKEHCTFRGVSVVQVAPGVREVEGVLPEDDYPGYLEREFATDPNRWRICSWHKNQRAMQTGEKPDDTGWGVYEACRNVGGIVATAHEHAYSRTFLMDHYESQSVVHRNDHMELAPGRSFAFVSGIGGHSIRTQKLDGDWWASVYSSTQGASYGALFCTFGESRAECRFEDIAGAVPDRFTLESASGAGGVEAPTPAPVMAAASEGVTVVGGEPVLEGAVQTGSGKDSATPVASSSTDERGVAEPSAASLSLGTGAIGAPLPLGLLALLLRRVRLRRRTAAA